MRIAKALGPSQRDRHLKSPRIETKPLELRLKAKRGLTESLPHFGIFTQRQSIDANEPSSTVEALRPCLLIPGYKYSMSKLNLQQLLPMNLRQLIKSRLRKL